MFELIHKMLITSSAYLGMLPINNLVYEFSSTPERPLFI